MKDLIPDRKAWLRATVSAIPYIGGALDHLIFDKADAIRLKNVEAALQALSDQLKQSQESQIDRAWFESEEALGALKLLSERVAFEHNATKVRDLGRLMAVCGTVTHSSDPMKLSVIDHLSRLSPVQLRILAAIAKTPPQQKQFSNSSIVTTATAVWINDLAEALKSGKRFWEGALPLAEELEVLESLNTVRRIPIFGPGELGYMLTALGRRAASFVETAGI